MPYGEVVSEARSRGIALTLREVKRQNLGVLGPFHFALLCRSCLVTLKPGEDICPRCGV